MIVGSHETLNPSHHDPPRELVEPLIWDPRIDAIAEARKLAAHDTTLQVRAFGVRIRELDNIGEDPSNDTGEQQLHAGAGS